MSRQKIVGRRECIELPEVCGDKVISAKIDTGAYGSALHCEDIRQNKNGELEFRPLTSKQKLVVVKSYRKRPVKSSSGHVEERFVISTKIIIMGKVYDIDVSLTDRSSMRWPMLIGRKFIGDNELLVDVRRFEGEYPTNLEKE